MAQGSTPYAGEPYSWLRLTQLFQFIGRKTYIELSSSGRFSALRYYLMTKCRQLRVQKPLLISRPFAQLPAESCTLPPPYNPTPPLPLPELPLILPSSAIGHGDTWYEAITTATRQDLVDIYSGGCGEEDTTCVKPRRVKEVDHNRDEPDSSLDREVPYIVVNNCSLDHPLAEMRVDSLKPPASAEQRSHPSWF